MPGPTLPDGPFTYRQARDLGWTRKRLRAALDDKLLRRVLRGVYVRSDLPDSIEVRVDALALVVSPHSVVCDRTAAWLHGVDVFGLGDQEILPPVETCVYRGRSRTQRSGVDGRTRDLLPQDVMVLGGIAVTTPLRTAMDLGCALGRHRALGTLDQFMRLHGVSHAAMYAEVPRFFRRRGVVQLRQLIPIADPRAESMRESWVRLDIHDAGLPVPELQVWVDIDGVPTYRLDLAYPKQRVVVEYDGEEFHRRTKEQKERDRERRRWLTDHGWTVIVIDKDGTSGLAADAWLRELRASLRPKTRRLRWSRPREVNDPLLAGAQHPTRGATTPYSTGQGSLLNGRGASSVRRP
jgi:hypothetical protein